MKTFILTLLSFLALSSSHALTTRADHSIWNNLLQENVTPTGHVNYKNLKINKNSVSKYLQELKHHAPSSDWTKEEKMAYYINLYNAYTIQFIITKYPVTSPKDINYSGKDIWKLRLVKTGKKTISLNDVENILKGYGDARIHFAINCGAISCPKLMNRAWQANTLESDLTKMTKLFINNSSVNIIKPKRIKISKLFEWYPLEFKTSTTTIIDFINTYSNIQISPKAKIEYLPYNWNLNE